MKAPITFGNICLIALVAFSEATIAGFEPSFDLDRAVLMATDIVVVTEGDEVDGNLLVQEVWTGRFTKGQQLSIPDLAGFADPEARTVRPWWPIPSNEKKPVILSGKTLILYMIRKENGTTNTEESFHWVPWRFVPEKGELRVSVVWLEGEKAYAFKQYARPGDSRLSLINFSKSELKSRSLRSIQNRGTLSYISAIADPVRRAQKAGEFIHSKPWLVQMEALQILSECGESGLAVLSSLLEKETNTVHFQRIVEAMTAVEEVDPGPHLIQVIKQEHEFWETQAPSLKAGWWNDPELIEHHIGRNNGKMLHELHLRHAKIHYVLHGLVDIGYEDDQGIVLALRELLNSKPEMDVTGDLVSMCDQIIGVSSK